MLVEIGGDLAVSGAKRDWRVIVAEREGTRGQQIGLTRGGLATSTTTVRTWRHVGRETHHIIDPRTGNPAEGPWRTATVAAGTAFAANVHSTAAIVKGAAACDWLERQGVSARLVDRDGRTARVNGWPQDGDNKTEPAPPAEPTRPADSTPPADPTPPATRFSPGTASPSC